MEKCTQGALNNQAIEELKKQTDLLFEMARKQSEQQTELLLVVQGIKTNGDWLKEEVESHIKKSTSNIKQIKENKDALIKQKSQLVFQWFAITTFAGGLFSMVFFIIKSGVLKT